MKKIKQAPRIESAAAAALELSYYGNGSAAAQLLLSLTTGTAALQNVGNFHPPHATGAHGVRRRPRSQVP